MPPLLSQLTENGTNNYHHSPPRDLFDLILSSASTHNGQLIRDDNNAESDDDQLMTAAAKRTNTSPPPTLDDLIFADDSDSPLIDDKTMAALSLDLLSDWGTHLDLTQWIDLCCVNSEKYNVKIDYKGNSQIRSQSVFLISLDLFIYHTFTSFSWNIYFVYIN